MVVTEERDPPWQASAWLLERKFPNEFGRFERHEVGKPGEFADVDPGRAAGRAPCPVCKQDFAPRMTTRLPDGFAELVNDPAAIAALPVERQHELAQLLDEVEVADARQRLIPLRSTDHARLSGCAGSP